jgi:putative ubiquitin-RnfH superfamily antitoxin RatB of RatAB toxin-antitoxin module
MKLSVVIALAEGQEVVDLELPGEPTVADAVSAARVAQRFAPLELSGCRFGLWGREAMAGTKLREGDRVELLRPLQADPKDARRKRATAARGKQG